MQRLVFLFLMLTHAWVQAKQPNVIVILTDDQGWGDLSLNGNTDLETPHIDSLARDGAVDRFVCGVFADAGGVFNRALSCAERSVQHLGWRGADGSR